MYPSVHPTIHTSTYPTIQMSKHPSIHPSTHPHSSNHPFNHPSHPTNKYSLRIYQASSTLDIRANKSSLNHSPDGFGHTGLHSVPGTCRCFPTSGPLNMSSLLLKHPLPSASPTTLCGHSYNSSDLSFSCTEDLTPLSLSIPLPFVFLS